MDDKILTLSTLDPDRPKVVIDGVAHEIALIEDFGLKQIAHLNKIARHIQQVVSDVEKATEADVERAEQELDEFVKTVVPSIAEETLAKLGFRHKSAIMQAFSLAVPTPATAASPTSLPASPTGEQPAVASSASTEALQPTGSISPSASSAPT